MSIIVQSLCLSSQPYQEWVNDLLGTDDAKQTIYLPSTKFTSITPTILICDQVTQLKTISAHFKSDKNRPFIIFLAQEIKEVDEIAGNVNLVLDQISRPYIYNVHVDQEMNQANIVWKHHFQKYNDQLQRKKFQIFLKMDCPNEEAPLFEKDVKYLQQENLSLDDVVDHLTNLQLYYQYLLKQSHGNSNPFPHRNKCMEQLILEMISKFDWSSDLKPLQKWMDLFFQAQKQMPFVPSTEISIINLEYRVDLWNQMDSQFKHLSLSFPYSRFTGTVNGYQDSKTIEQELYTELPKAFQKNVTGKRLDLGELGCWLSHIRLWKAIQQSKKPRLVLENQAILGPVFARDWPKVEQIASHAKLSFIWIGYHVEKSLRAEMMLDMSCIHSVPMPLDSFTKVKINHQQNVPLPAFIGGTFGYYIDPEDAKFKLSALKNAESPIIHPLDIWMFRLECVQYAVKRPLVWHSYEKKVGDILKHQRDN